MLSKPNTLAEDSLFLAAIGASAGGLDALTEFLSYLPEQIENLAIVIAQHLSPNHPSQLAALLAHVTAWPVSDIQAGMMLEPGKVYVVPPHHEVSFSGRSFILNDSPADKGPKPSVEGLFRALAAESSLHPIAIVLSGTGRDGSQGLAAIKAVGGWTFAQAPETAPFNGMPLAAIETGQIDFVLAPALMVPKLQQLLNETSQTVFDTDDKLSSNPLPDLLKRLTQRRGTDFSHYKSSTLLRRIKHRQLLLKLPDLPSYLDWVQRYPQELDVLFQAILIGVTGFFRDPQVFAGLEDCLVQMLQQKKPDEPVRIWVPGCSTGEEAYTLAIIIDRLLQAQQLTIPVQIFATDIDQGALTQARRGIYSQEALKYLSADLLENCFTLEQGSFAIKKHLSSSVLFSAHDLTAQPPFLKLDLISCRNLLIYFDSGIQKSILSTFHSSLNPQGLLVLGQSESVDSVKGLFEAVQSELKIYRPLPMAQSSKHHFRHSLLSTSFTSVTAQQAPAEHAWSEIRNEILAVVFDYPCVLVNADFELLHIDGDVSPFLDLSQALLTNQLLEICRPEHQLELRSLLIQARHEGQAIYGAFRRLHEGQKELLRIHVHPNSQHKTAQILVVFEKVELPLLIKPHASEGVESEHIAELKQELFTRETRMKLLLEQLDLSHEQQQILNEELQSANEELQAMNEELATSNEELVTSNEELRLAYAELQTTHTALASSKVQLLSSATHLSTLLENTVQAFVLVDKDYRILKCNQQAIHLHQTLYQQDLAEGQLIIDSFSNAVLLILLPLLQQALQQGQSIRHEFKVEQLDDDAPAWLRYDLIPVAGPDQDVSLAISCLDISLEKEAQLALERSSLLIDSVFNATEIGLSLKDNDGRFLKVNDSICKLFGYQKAELLNLHNWELVPPEQQEEVRQSNKEFSRTGSLPPQERRVKSKDGRLIDIYINTHLLTLPDGSQFKVASYQDITAQKKDKTLLADTLEMTGIGGWELDLPGGELHWTPEIYAIYGQSPDQPIDVESGLQAYLPESRARLELALQSAIEAGKPYELELELRRQNGEHAWVRSTCRVTQENGQTTRLYGTFRDITQQRQAEASVHKLSLVAQHTPNMVLITDAAFQIEFANSAYLQETGYSLAELRGQSPLFLQGEKTDPFTLTRIVKALTQQREVREEILFYSRDLEPFWCEIVITPVAANIDQPACYIVIQTNITERKQRNDLLLFQSDILAHVNDAIVVCDLAGQISYWNSGAERIYGYSMEEQIGKPIDLGLWAPEFNAQAFLALNQSGNNPPSYHEIQHQHKDGSEVWVSQRRDLIYNAEGAPVGIIGVSRDVTKERQISAALRTSEQTFRALVEKSTDGVLVMSADGTVSYASASAERLLGYTAEVLKTKILPNLVHPLDQAMTSAALSDLAKHPGKSDVREFRHRHANQSWIWIECTVTNMLHEPSLNGFVCNFRDITQRKESEYNLQQHEQLYRSIAENFPGGLVMVLDQQLNTIYIEGQDTNTLLRRPLGENYLAGFSLTIADSLQEHLNQALIGKQQDFELFLEDAWYAFSIVPLREKTDAQEFNSRAPVSRLLVVTQNITDTKRATEEKNLLIQELTSKNEDLNQFTYIISHNLRAPVANLKGLLHLIELEQLIQPSGLEIVDNFSLTVAKLDQTILDLNNILNIRRQRDEISQEVDLMAELAWTLDNLTLLAPEIQKWVQSDLRVTHCFSIKSYLQSMLHNLISNAIKYSDPQRAPEIQITSGRSDGFVWIACQDNGLGLDLTQVENKIFRLYMRFHPHIEGKGMGLYLIKTQAEALSGGVEISSELGKGTRFYVCFKESLRVKEELEC